MLPKKNPITLLVIAMLCTFTFGIWLTTLTYPYYSTASFLFSGTIAVLLVVKLLIVQVKRASLLGIKRLILLFSFLTSLVFALTAAAFVTEVVNGNIGALLFFSTLWLAACLALCLALYAIKKYLAHRSLTIKL